MSRTKATRSRLGALTAAAVGAAALVLAAPGAAHAVPLGVQYDVEGTSTLAANGSTLNLGPAVLDIVAESSTGEIVGSLPLPDTVSEFRAFGFAPVRATVSFEEAAPLTGQLGRSPNGPVVSTTASYTLKLSDVRIGGFPAFVGNNCRTAEPVVIPTATPEGQRFDLTRGGPLTGTYAIGEFENCGFSTSVINGQIVGDGNTVDLVAANGRLS